MKMRVLNPKRIQCSKIHASGTQFQKLTIDIVTVPSFHLFNSSETYVLFFVKGLGVRFTDRCLDNILIKHEFPVHMNSVNGGIEVRKRRAES
jgi:hypothetical protein